jgi:hypothetical protein
MLIAYGEPYTAVLKKNGVKNNRKLFSWMPEIEDILVSFLEIRCLNRYQFGKSFDEILTRCKDTRRAGKCIITATGLFGVVARYAPLSIRQPTNLYGSLSHIRLLPKHCTLFTICCFCNKNSALVTIHAML